MDRWWVYRQHMGHGFVDHVIKGIYIILEGNSFTNLRASVNRQGTAGTLGVDCSSKRALFEPPQDAPDLCLPHLQLPHQSGFRCSTPQGLLQAHTCYSSGQPAKASRCKQSSQSHSFKTKRGRGFTWFIETETESQTKWDGNCSKRKNKIKPRKNP